MKAFFAAPARGLLTLLPMALASQAAMATYYPPSSGADFSFTGLHSGSKSSYTATVDGLTVMISPASKGKLTYSKFNGIGLDTGLFDDHRIDDSEKLTINFSETVTVGKVNFSDWKWGLFANDKVMISANDQTITYDGHKDYVSLGSLGALDSFTLMSKGNHSKFWLAGIKNVETSEVPVPAAAWLFGSALVGLGLGKRRK